MTTFAVRHFKRNLRSVFPRIPTLATKCGLFRKSQCTFTGNAEREEIDKFVKSADIVMFSKTTCPFCMAAKSILNKYNNEYKVMELNKVPNGFTIQDHLYGFTGSSTVPQIFIHQEFVGGATDLMQLDSDGKLKDMIERIEV